MFFKDFPKLLKERRNRLKMTAKEVSYVVGCDTNTVFRWEHGTSTPSPRYHEGLEKFFSIPIEDHKEQVA